MPIYEYECEKCGKEFELLVRGDTKAVCPGCGSEKLRKRFSAFAAHDGAKANAVPPCCGSGRGCDLGKCGSGRCGLE